MNNLCILLICLKLLNNDYKLSDIILTFNKDKKQQLKEQYYTKSYKIPDILKSNTRFITLIKKDHINYYNTKFVKILGMKQMGKQKRKNADYQYTEFLTAYALFNIEEYDNDKIIDFMKNKLDSKQLMCNCIHQYINDYNIDISNNKPSYTTEFIKKYIIHFHKCNDNLKYINLDNINIVYLTGKTYTEFEKLVELNKGLETYKPNSDVYYSYNDGEIDGISCKKDNKSPLTNKIVEDHINDEGRDKLTKERIKVLEKFKITEDNYDKNTNFNIPFYGENSYWDKIEKHVKTHEIQFIKGVLHSISQGYFLTYNVFEYNGIDLENTKERYLDCNKCHINRSEIFCYKQDGNKRQAAKMWFNFKYNNDIIYNLEVRFKIGSNKKTYFKNGGSPQLFIYKPTPKEVADKTNYLIKDIIDNLIENI